jgi:hypothetical protein
MVYSRGFWAPLYPVAPGDKSIISRRIPDVHTPNDSISGLKTCKPASHQGLASFNTIQSNFIVLDLKPVNPHCIRVWHQITSPRTCTRTCDASRSSEPIRHPVTKSAKSRQDALERKKNKRSNSPRPARLLCFREWSIFQGTDSHGKYWKGLPGDFRWKSSHTARFRDRFYVIFSLMLFKNCQ